MKITDKEYLENVLNSIKIEKEEIEVKNRIAIAEFNAKRELLQRQIDSIEKQLDNGIII